MLKQSVACGDVGEILVSGRHVLKQYVDNPSANAENKIRRTQSNKNDHHPVWHRTGDTGFLDDTGQLWLTGRVKDSLVLNGGVIQPYPLEQSLDNVAGIVRSALIHFNDALHVFVQNSVESSQAMTADIRCEIEQILQAAGVHHFNINVIELMPVDGRHNSKIDRLALRNALQKNSH